MSDVEFTKRNKVSEEGWEKNPNLPLLTLLTLTPVKNLYNI